MEDRATRCYLALYQRSLRFLRNCQGITSLVYNFQVPWIRVAPWLKVRWHDYRGIRREFVTVIGPSVRSETVSGKLTILITRHRVIGQWSIFADRARESIKWGAWRIRETKIREQRLFDWMIDWGMQAGESRIVIIGPRTYVLVQCVELSLVRRFRPTEQSQGQWIIMHVMMLYTVRLGRLILCFPRLKEFRQSFSGTETWKIEHAEVIETNVPELSLFTLYVAFVSDLSFRSFNNVETTKKIRMLAQTTGEEQWPARHLRK
jgi:hypothetical protein